MGDETNHLESRELTTALPASLLLVEDEEYFASRIKKIAQAEGWLLRHCWTWEDGLNTALHGGHDLLILDRMLNDGSGDALSLISELRRQELNLPTIVLSAIGSSLQRTRGFSAGADIYLEKPFEDAELAAAVAAILRRYGYGRSKGAIFQYGGLELRLHSETASWRGLAYTLSPQSFAILELLTRGRGGCVSRKLLWHQIWPEWRAEPQNDVIDQAIFRLRQEMKNVPDGPQVKTIRRRGYSLNIQS
ncbi:response regulator transcription factor [Parasphingorhabdus sp.]|uniref:response regulator transcription factor n=1 Tax=Parasphingorhabdus sp. TaxID=2709688 RepID=UPI003A90F428